MPRINTPTGCLTMAENKTLVVQALYPYHMNKLIDVQAKRIKELELENEKLKRERNVGNKS